ncbi:MAG: hypothetical protein P8169_08865, partial [Chloroflexota bacterium]
MTRTLLLLALLITLGIGSLGTAAFLLLQEAGEPIEQAAAAVEETAPVMQPALARFRSCFVVLKLVVPQHHAHGDIRS